MMHIRLMQLLRENVITIQDLEGFSAELREEMELLTRMELSGWTQRTCLS